MVHKAGYLLANGDIEELTELQFHAIPHMLVLYASLENGTYKGPVKEDDIMTIEELTELRLNGKSPNRSTGNVRFYTESTDVKEWVTVRELE